MLLFDESNQDEIEENEEIDYFLPEGYEEGDEEESDDYSDDEESEEELEDDSEDTEDPEEAEESDEGSEDEEEPTSDFELKDLELNVLGEKKLLGDIPKEELQPTLQKGYDYDRVRGQRNDLQDEVNEWKEISDMFDMSPDDVKNALKEQKFKQIAETEGRNIGDVRNEYASNRKTKQEKMYAAFIDKYPDIKVDDLPLEVKESVQNGEDLLTAYEKHSTQDTMASKDKEILELKKQIEDLTKKENTKKQNKASKKKGVVKPSKGNDIKHDDFLDGFLD